MIKRIVTFMTVLGVLLTLSVLGYAGYAVYNFEQPTPEQIAQRAAEQAERQRQELVDRMTDIRFFRDTTTGLCFAYLRGTSHGLGLDTVDCTTLSNSSVTEFTSRTK